MFHGNFYRILAKDSKKKESEPESKQKNALEKNNQQNNTLEDKKKENENSNYPLESLNSTLDNLPQPIRSTLDTLIKDKSNCNFKYSFRTITSYIIQNIKNESFRNEMVNILKEYLQIDLKLSMHQNLISEIQAFIDEPNRLYTQVNIETDTTINGSPHFETIYSNSNTEDEPKIKKIVSVSRLAHEVINFLKKINPSLYQLENNNRITEADNRLEPNLLKEISNIIKSMNSDINENEIITLLSNIKERLENQENLLSQALNVLIERIKFYDKVEDKNEANIETLIIEGYVLTTPESHFTPVGRTKAKGNPTMTIIFTSDSLKISFKPDKDRAAIESIDQNLLHLGSFIDARNINNLKQQEENFSSQHSFAP